MNTIKIIITDDHALFRLGERTVITQNLPQAEILAEYGSGEELLIYLKNGIHPDIILLDVLMQGMNGIEVAKILKKKYPHIKIIILSSEIATKTVNTLLSIGVDAYLSKLTINNDLTKAIESVMEGELFYGKEITKIAYDLFLSKQRAKLQKAHPSILQNPLTERETEIIKLYCDGIPSRKIAEQLFISQKTVENHKSNVMKKMGFESNVDLIRYAIKAGIITL